MKCYKVPSSVAFIEIKVILLYRMLSRHCVATPQHVHQQHPKHRPQRFISQYRNYLGITLRKT